MKDLLEKVSENELFKFLGISVETAAKERVVLKMEVTPRVHQYMGIMNGGVSMYLSETAASIGAVLNVDLEKYAPVGIEINGNHLRAIAKGIITIEAVPTYIGRTMQVWNINITNDRGKLVCTSRCSVMVRKGGAFTRTD
jgi:uncharacterized protein (TIGR00369 family)